MTAELLMLCPSRGRPGRLAELLHAWHATSTPGVAKLLVALDDDDPQLEGYQTMAWDLRATTFTVNPRERLGPTLNRLALEHAAGHFAIGFLGDDHRPRTRGWDARMVQALRELGTGVAYGNDLLQGANLASAVAMTSDIVATLGYMIPPGMIHLYLDNFWMALGHGLDRLAYLPDVVIEHVHPVAGKAEWDAGYLEVNAPELYAADRGRFATYIADHLDRDLEKLRARMASV